MRAVWGGQRARASVFSLGITSSRKHALQRNAKWNFSHSCCFRCSLPDTGAHKCLWNVHTWVENPLFSGVESIPCFVDFVCLFYATRQSDKSNSLTRTTQFAPPEGQLYPSVSPRLHTSVDLPRFFFFAGCKFCFAFCVATEGHLLAFVISRPKASFFFFFFSQCERVSSNKSKTWSSLCLLQNALCREPKRLQLQSVSYTTLSTFFPLKWFGPQTLTGWGEAISVLQTWEPEPRVHPFVMGNRLSWTVIDFLEGSWYFEGIYFDWISDKPSVVESQGKSTKKVYGS